MVLFWNGGCPREAHVEHHNKEHQVHDALGRFDNADDISANAEAFLMIIFWMDSVLELSFSSNISGEFDIVEIAWKDWKRKI